MGTWLQAELGLALADALPAFRDWLGTGGAEALGGLGGSVWGCWPGGPGIGLRSDAVLLFTHWSDDAAAGAATELLRNAPAVVAVEGTPLRATVRPTDADPVRGAGWWVFRDFELGQADVERFVALSAEAWTSFEARFGARIDGLFRAPDPDADRARLLLVTRYADLGTWEASRSAEEDPESRERFRERRALVRWTRARCAPHPAS